MTAARLHAVAGFRGFNPAAYGTVGGWWKADAIAGVTNGGSLASWLDSSGNARPAVPPGTAPLYETNQQNGLPIVRFSSSDTHMSVVGYQPGNVSSPFNMSIFVVLKVASNASSGEILSTRQGSGGFLLRALASQAGYGWFWIGGSSTTVSASAGSWHLAEVIQVGTSIQVGVDGTLNSAVTFSGWTASTGAAGNLILGLGSSNALAADIGEILFYTSTVSSRSAIENYLVNKWALP